jgi:hypothetical protein
MNHVDDPSISKTRLDQQRGWKKVVGGKQLMQYFFGFVCNYLQKMVKDRKKVGKAHFVQLLVLNK